MARAANTFRDEAVAAGLHATEIAAINAWADAHEVYFTDAEANGIPVVPTALPTATAAMAAAMTGLSTTGPAAIQAGITAFWSAMVAAPATFFSGATLIVPPPGLTTIQADIELAAPVNVANANDAETALGFIAGGGAGGNLGIHTLTLTGATATFPGPIVAPIL